MFQDSIQRILLKNNGEIWRLGFVGDRCARLLEKETNAKAILSALYEYTTTKDFVLEETVHNVLQERYADLLEEDMKPYICSVLEEQIKKWRAEYEESKQISNSQSNKM